MYAKGGLLSMEETTRIVIKKAAKVKPVIDLETGKKILKRVCAYARVSTDFEDQKNSYDAQLREYTERITKNPDWEFVKMYSDEGITGTCLSKREGFQEMIDDAMAGKIDLILVKSVSRFARNTVDCLQTIRDLRAKQVDVFFDKENISIFDPGVELMLTIHASFAQEESKSISENVKWGVRKRMAKGDRRMYTKTTLGYDEVDGKIIVNKEGAKVIQKIYDMYLEGNSMRDIAKYLNNKKIPKKGSEEDWKIADIMRILGNEKYIGDFVMQKTVVVDFLTHKAVKNDGVVEQYIVPNHHEAIISKPVFEAVQAMRSENKKFTGGMLFEPINKLTSILYCSSCLRPMRYGDVKPFYDRKREFLTCRATYRTDKVKNVSCDIHSTLEFNMAQAAAFEVVNKFLSKDKEVFENIKEAYDYAIEKAHLDLIEYKNAAVEINERMEMLIKLATSSDDIYKYKDEYEELDKKLDATNKKIEMIKKDIAKSAKQYFGVQALNKFYQDKAITYSVLKTVIKAAFRLKDNSIRFVLSDEPLTINRELFNKVMELEPIYTSSVSGDRKKELHFDVVRIGG